MKTITGTFRYPDDSPVALGVLRLKLSQDAAVTSTAQIAPREVTVTLDANGAIPASTQIWANDELSPSGTVYFASLYSGLQGGRVFGQQSWSIAGASPIDLNGITPTSVSVSLVDPILKNPAGDQAIQDFKLTLPNLNNILFVDGEKYAQTLVGIQAAIDAAFAAGGGIVYVPDSYGGTIAGQIEMKSNVHLIFGADTYTNTGASGGVMVNFAVTVSNARVSGQGVGATILKNNSTGTQFGAVVQDKGTDNTVASLTMDGNGNTTSTYVTQAPTRNRSHNLKIIHDLITDGGVNFNYAWHIRGGTDYEAANIEVIGGSIDAIYVEALNTWGSVNGGKFSNITCRLSPANGLDITAIGSGLFVSNTTWTNVRCVGNGTKDVGNDDEYGLTLFGASSGVVENNTFVGLDIQGNKMSGLVTKGIVRKNTFLAVSSHNNGIGTGNGHAVFMRDDTSTAPSANYIQGVVREAGVPGNHAIATEASASLNVYVLDIGSDSISLGSTQDVHHFIKGTAGVTSTTAIDFTHQSLSAAPAAPSISNVSGVGIVLNSSAEVRIPGPTLNVKRLKADQGTALVAGDFTLSAGWGTTASIGTISGTDQGFRAVVTSTGTGQGASPTVTLTFKDGTWANAPVFVCIRGGGSQPTVQFSVTNHSATTLQLTFNGTPVNTETYTLTCVGMGR